MYIDFTLKINEFQIDLSIDQKQLIGEAIKNIPNFQRQNLSNFYFSQMQNRAVSIYKTLEEENIRNGDKLISFSRRK